MFPVARLRAKKRPRKCGKSTVNHTFFRWFSTHVAASLKQRRKDEIDVVLITVLLFSNATWSIRGHYEKTFSFFFCNLGNYESIPYFFVARIF